MTTFTTHTNQIKFLTSLVILKNDGHFLNKLKLVFYIFIINTILLITIKMLAVQNYMYFCLINNILLRVHSHKPFNSPKLRSTSTGWITDIYIYLFC